MQTSKLLLPNISCSRCASVIKKVLHSLEGVDTVRVDVLQKTVTISYDNRISYTKILRLLRSTGYPPKQAALFRSTTLQLPLSIALSLPFMIFMVIMFFVPFHYPLWLRITELLCTVIIVFILGHDIIAATFRSFMHFSFGMESLIGIGSVSACVSGMLHLFGFPFESFLSIGSMIMVIHFIGMHIRNKCTSNAGNAVQKLLELGAKTAQKVCSDGKIRDVPIESVEKGDTVIVGAGSSIPVDGVILQGTSFVDESMITGEFLPNRKTIGDAVTGGAINQDGLIHVQANRLGEESFLSRVVMLVEKAQMTKVPIQELADKIAAVFVPLVVGLSLVSGLSWVFFPKLSMSMYSSVANYIPWLETTVHTNSQAMLSFIATLVIACPCALGLATPTAISVGIGAAARQGMLIKHASAIQAARAVSAISFDKTGTLTEGKPHLVHLYCIEDRDATLRAAASVLAQSTHPLAQAIRTYAVQQGIEPSKIETHSVLPGYGVQAEYDGTTWYIGSTAYMESLSLTTEHLAEYNRTYPYASRVYIAKHSAVIGICYMEDTIQKDAEHSIKELHRLGIKTYLFSGDTPKAVQKLSSAVGISGAFGGLSPHDKIERIKTLQSDHTCVAMVGDGINDAPALKQADLSIAIGQGTDIAIETADIVLVNKKLINCQRVVTLSKRTMTIINQNLLWAFLFNVLAIPFAMLGVLHPIVAEAAMALSSILVVLNALRLRSQAKRLFKNKAPSSR